MIGQGIGLPHLVPLALDRLEENPWAAGHMFPGDLLKITAGTEYALTRPDLRARLGAVVRRALEEIPDLPFDGDDGLPNLDVPSRDLAEALAGELRGALDRLES